MAAARDNLYEVPLLMMRPGFPAWMVSLLCVVGTAGAQTPAVTRSVDRVRADILSAKTEKFAPDRGKITVAVKAGLADKLKVFDGAGREVPSITTASGAIEAVIDPRLGHVLAPAVSPPRRKLPAEGLEFPARYMTVSPQGATVLGGLFLRPARTPLSWDDQLRAYATELFVGYEFVDGAERPLAAPKTVAFFVEGAQARIEADTVVVKQSGSEGYQRVTLTTNEVEGDTLFHARAGPNDELKGSVSVRREPSRLVLTLPATELPAFGVGSGMLGISLLAQDGRPLAPDGPLAIQLSSRRLRLPSSVTLAAGQSFVEVPLRSAGYGQDEITAQAGHLQASVAVRLVFPLAALAAAVVGGALGGAARHLRRWRGQLALFARRTTEGGLVGVIVVGAAWAGLLAIDVGTGPLGTPFGALVLAALGGFVGSVLLEKIARKTFGSVSGD